MKLIHYYKSFLENSANLSATRITLLDKPTETITNVLKTVITFLV